eukprot:s2761_g2.t1
MRKKNILGTPARQFQRGRGRWHIQVELEVVHGTLDILSGPHVVRIDVGTIQHSTRSPNLSWQLIMGTGNKPRDLYPGNQGGTSSGHGQVTLVGRGGGSPKDQARSIGHAQAMAKASQAVNDAEAANEDAAVPRGQVSEMVGLAATLVEHLAGGGGKKGGLTAEEVEAHYAAKGKRKGKSKPMEDPVTDEAATDEAEESEESPQGLDPIVEGRDDDAEDGGGAADGAETLSHPGTGTGGGTTATGTTTTATTGTTTTGPTTLTEVPQSSMTELQEESEEASSSTEPRRILRSPYSRAYGQAVWSGQIGWGDDLPPHLHPRPEEYGNATWPETPEDEAAGSSSDAAPGSSNRLSAEEEHALRVSANMPPELNIAPTGTAMVPLPTVDEDVPADDNQATAGNDAPDETNTPADDDTPAENEVPVNDEGGTGAGTLEEEEQPLPPRVNREEGEHGMGPPPTKWDQGAPGRPPMMPQMGCKGAQPGFQQCGGKGAQLGFQQCGGGKGAGMVQQPYMQQGPHVLRGQDARIRMAQQQHWVAICKLNAPMGMLPPRPVVDYSLELQPLQQPPGEGLHGGGASSMGAYQGTTSKAAGAGGSTSMPMPRATAGATSMGTSSVAPEMGPIKGDGTATTDDDRCHGDWSGTTGLHGVWRDTEPHDPYDG